MTRRIVAALWMILGLAVSAAALAAEPVPGSSCSTYAANSFQWAGGPENTGVTNGMFCVSNVWTGVIDFESSGRVGIGTTSPAARLHVNGEAIIGNTSLVCGSTVAGGLRYNSATFKMELCDGTSWTSLAASNGGQAPAAALGDGYLVLTSGTWNGNLGGRAGGNAKCLTDLTNNDWKNKSTAVANGQLVAGKVQSFLCDQGSACNNLTPLARYFFAVSGNTSAGGAYFDTDSSGLGPNNSYAWNASNYFNGSVLYWSGRDAGSATVWASTGWTSGSSGTNCGSWTSTSTGFSGATGDASTTTVGRWINTAHICNTVLALVCLVNP